jgi:hypothetical protein
MNEKLQNDLIKTYPKIFKNIGGDPMVTCMAWGIECNDGWYDLLDTLCYTMQQHCTAANTRYIIETDKYEFIEEGDPEYVQVVAAQVKEKLGTLRFYVDGGDASTEAMIELAEAMSGRICELCGSPARRNTDSGWLHTTCTACNLKRQGWVSGSAEEFLTDSNPDNNPDKVSEQFSQEMSQEMWDSLNQELWDRRMEMTEMEIEIARLTKERDEARRMYCECSAPHLFPEKEDTDSAAFQSHCHSCGVPWASHAGIAKTCAENAQLRRERDEARREVCEINAIESSNESVDFLSLTPQDIADERGWDCYASDTLSQDVEFYISQDAKLRKGIEEAKQGKFSKTPPKIKPTREEEIEQLRKERDEANSLVRRILTEINCRIEHGADSNGHLEGLYEIYKEQTK